MKFFFLFYIFHFFSLFSRFDIISPKLREIATQYKKSSLPVKALFIAQPFYSFFITSYFFKHPEYIQDKPYRLFAACGMTTALLAALLNEGFISFKKLLTEKKQYFPIQQTPIQLHFLHNALFSLFGDKKIVHYEEK